MRLDVDLARYRSLSASFRREHHRGGTADGSAGGDWIHGVAEGGDPVLYVELQSLPTTLQTRAAAVILVVAAAVAAISLLRRPAAWDVVCRWPHAVGFLLGIAYWAVLWPSWLGILIAIASLLLGIRTSWPGRSMRSDGSTVVRAVPR